MTVPSVEGHEGRTSTVHTVDLGDRELVADTVPPVRPLAEIAPVAVWTSPSGATLVDFGVNLVGWVRVVASGAAGTVLTLRHAEVLEHDELGTRPLRTALATDHFTLSGSGPDAPDRFEPRSRSTGSGTRRSTAGRARSTSSARRSPRCRSVPTSPAPAPSRRATTC